MASDGTPGEGLTDAERERLAAFRAAGTLADLVALTGADTEHGAYLRAKEEWYDLRGRELAPVPAGEGLPGDRVVVGGTPYRVHGVTHADTDAERAYLREHVSALLAAGEGVYCEQGIRPMYFADYGDVCEMDDYRWAMQRCRELGVDSHVGDLVGEGFDGLAENLDTVIGRFRAVAFGLVDAGSGLYGERFARALGDVAASFLTSHEDLAVGADFESFAIARRAAEDPGHLADLQNYYRRAFLPQPLEREWLRRHDRELEIVTHARNERMADYAVYHHEDAPAVHLIVGAAHQPGVTYYLERHRDGERDVADFRLVE
jgi:hypothetical protein